MKRYKVSVKVPGKIVTFKNRKIRTPFELELTDNDLKLLKFAMVSSGIESYKIELYNPEDNVEEPSWEDIIMSPEKEVVIEDLYGEEEPTTILGKLLKSERDGNRNEEK